MSFAVFVNLFGAGKYFPCPPHPLPLAKSAKCPRSLLMQPPLSGLLTLFVPQLTLALTYGDNNYEAGQSRLLAIFAGFNVLALLLIFFFVPETAGATFSKEEGRLNYISLEELNYIFGVSTLQHISYQLQYVVPWALSVTQWTIGHYVLRKEVEKPPNPNVLYTWVDIRGVEKARKKREKETAMAEDDKAKEEIDSPDQPVVPKKSMDISVS